MINLTRAIKYSFSGSDFFTKLFIGAIMVIMLPLGFITGLILLGYQLRVIRTVMEGDEANPPDWDQFGTDLAQGFVVLLGSLIYYLPAFILAGLGGAFGWDVISSLGSRLRAAIDPFNTVVPTPIDRGELSMMVICFALALIWLLLSAPMLMAATARYAETGKFSSFVNMLERADEVWDNRKAAASLTLSLLILMMMAQLAGTVASATCLLTAYVQYAQFLAICHLTGQWGRVLKQNRPKPNVIRPIKPRPMPR